MYIFNQYLKNPLRFWCFLAVLAAIWAVLLALPLFAQDNSGRRIALVIGNAAYKNVAELKNPTNDSTDLAKTLVTAGFEVELHSDQDQGAMLDTLRGFRRRADGADIALIYFAGHGIEIDRQNYLLPVDAVLETDADVNFEAVKLETLVFAASGAQRLSMVIVDACRNNPFAASMKLSNASRSINRGLSAFEPSKNTLVAYAAKGGTTAADGAGRNSPYASALIDALEQPGLEVGLMMRRVRDGVLKATAGKQEPFVYGSLSADPIFLNESRGVTPVAPTIVSTDTDVEAVPVASAAEIVFWTSIADTEKLSLLEAYLDLYPDGFFADLALAKIKDLSADEAPAPDQVASLVTAAPAVSAPPAPPEIARVLTRAEKVEIQERLLALGYSVGVADGITGHRTEAAIRSFEEAENLPVLGLSSLTILTALRGRVTDTDLAGWRAQQAQKAANAKAAKAKAAKAKAAKAKVVKPKVVKPKATTTKAVQPKVTPPKVVTPAQTEAPKVKTVTKKITPKPANKYKQFCAANRQCATSECRTGKAGDFWRKTRGCRFCSVHAERCL